MIRQTHLTIIASFCLVGLSVGFFIPQKTRMLCINSSSPNVQSMCVSCDSQKFMQTSMMCTGQSMVPANTNQTQAFCLISNCLQQVRQQGQSIGRRKRFIELSGRVTTALGDALETDSD